MEKHTKSYLDLVSDCDNFPYDTTSIQDQLLYKFQLPEDVRPHGYILQSVVDAMPWTSDFTVHHESKTVQIALPSTQDVHQASNDALQKLIDLAIEKDVFRVLGGQHSEPYAIIGANYPITVERYASTLFGIITRGAHMTVYTHTPPGLRIWVPRRALNSFTYPGCLDTTVAGGVAAGESPFECVVREAEEEASLPEQLVHPNAIATGVLSYMGFSDERSGGEVGLITPDMLYVFDLEVDEHVICQPHDAEVQGFSLMSVDDVKKALERGEFKANSALVMIDFFVRHGVITADNESHYAEIIMRLHRRLPFPLSPIS